MTIRLNPRWLLVSALMLSLQFCRAQVEVPSNLSFDLGTTDAPPTSQLWDVGGSYSVSLLVEQKSGIEVPIILTFNLIQAANGKLSTVSNDFGQGLDVSSNSFFAITPSISGKVTGAGGIARVHFTVRFKGIGTLAGHPNVPVSGSLTIDAETDASSDQLVGVKVSKFSAGFSGFSSIKGTTLFASDLPPGVDGSWNLSLQLVALGKVTGTGIITTPSRTLGLDMNGAFKGGIFKIKAKGATDVQDTQSGVGSTANIILTTAFDSITLNGKILGQKLSFSTAPSGE
jgi:hypothetical protein